MQVMINTEVAKIEKWMHCNKLSLNHKKTKYMLVHSKRSNIAFNLYINNNKIEQVASFEYLGVIIDEKLKWSEHIKFVGSNYHKHVGQYQE